MSQSERDALVKLATEFWRLSRAFERSIIDLPSEKQTRASSQLRYSASRLPMLLSEAGLQIVSYDNEPFEPNLPVSIENADQLQAVDALVIERTLEPTILCDGQVLAVGKVSVKQRGN